MMKKNDERQKEERGRKIGRGRRGKGRKGKVGRGRQGKEWGQRKERCEESGNEGEL